MKKLFRMLVPVLGLLAGSAAFAETVVEDGKVLAANLYYQENWSQRGDELIGFGTNRFLLTKYSYAPEKFHVQAELMLETQNSTAVTFVMGKYALGLDGGGNTPYFFEVQGEPPVKLVSGARTIRPGVRFRFEAIGKNGNVQFKVDGKTVAEFPIAVDTALCFGFRPQRNTLHIKNFTIDGTRVGVNTEQYEEINNICPTVPAVPVLWPINDVAQIPLKGKNIPLSGSFTAELSSDKSAAKALTFPLALVNGKAAVPAEFLRQAWQNAGGKNVIRPATLSLQNGGKEVLKNRILLANPELAVNFPQGKVIQTNGRPAFEIDGEALSTMTARNGRTYWMQFFGRAVKQFAAAGIHENIVILFPYQYTSPDRELKLDTAKLLENLEEFAARTIAEDGDARFVLYYDLRMPETFVRDYPEEVIRLDNGKESLNYGVNGKLQPSYASEVWRAKAGENLREFLTVLRSSPVADRVAAVKLLYANCGEWNHWGYHEEAFVDFSKPMQRAFGRYLQEKYQTLEAFQTAWGRKDVTFASENFVPDRAQRMAGGPLRNAAAGQTQVADYYEFFQMYAVKTIEHFAKIAKEASGNRLLVGSYYGYYWGHYGNNPYHFQDSGNYGLRYLLSSPFLDFIGGPNMYPWRDTIAPVNGASASLALHGKVWESEGDMRTHHTPKEDAHYGLPKNLSESIAVLKRNYCTELAARSNFYFYDFVYDWYRDEEFMDTVGKLVKIDRFLRSQPDRTPAQIAFILSEEVVPRLGIAGNYDELTGFARSAIELFCIGAPYDVYVESDLAGIDFAQYKVVIFPNSFYVSDQTLKLVKERVLKDNRTAIFYHAPGVITPELGYSDARMQELTGIALHFDPAMRTETVAKFPETVPQIRDYAATGRVTVTDENATQIAVHPDGACAGAIKKLAHATSIVIAHPVPNPAFLRAILKADGKVNLYAEKQYEWMFYANSMIGVFSRSGGVQDVNLPFTAEIAVDMFSGEVLGKNVQSFHVVMPGDKPEMRMIYVGSSKDWQKFSKELNQK